MMVRVIINTIFGLCVFLVGAIVVNATTLGVSPVRVTLSEKQKVGTLIVRNDGTEPVPMQLEIVNWSKEDGKDVFSPTRELIVNPPIFKVPAGGSQLIRVGLRGRTDAQRELTYRIFLQELPSPPDPNFNGTKLLMRLSLPVFVLPKVTAKPVLQWQAERISDGALKVSLTNVGNEHIQIINFSLSQSGSAQPWITQNTSDYVLIGKSFDWILQANQGYSIPQSGTSMKLFAETDAGDIEAEVLVLP
ncbi:molecular chaperone [Amylibacter sp.]|nr:molecular chaperone [Amylibacter sp.]